MKLMARTYVSYSDRSASVSVPSVDFSASSSSFCWTWGDARKPAIRAATSGVKQRLTGSNRSSRTADVLFIIPFYRASGTKGIGFSPRITICKIQSGLTLSARVVLAKLLGALAPPELECGQNHDDPNQPQKERSLKPRVIIIESHLIMSSRRSEDHVDFRYFETVNCPDQDQWLRCLHDLSTRLCDSGLGSVLFDPQSSGDSAVNHPSTGDQLVELRNLNYGRPLLDEWVRDNRIQVERPIIPCRWQAYACDEYFADGWWDPARYDPEDYLEVMEVMLDYTRIYEVLEHEFLAVASPGFDRTGFGFRKQHKGIWAFYPREDRFEFKTPNLAALREGWFDNTVTF